MQINTIIKLGSLAFNVAQDDRLRELLKMAHNGAKRRGLLTPPSAPPGVHPWVDARNRYWNRLP